MPVALRSRPSWRWLGGIAVAAVVLPALLFGLVAWRDQEAEMLIAQGDVRDTAQILAQHAGNVFGTQTLVARLVDEHIKAMTWQDIGASASLHDYLAALTRQYPQIAALWLIDPAGEIRNSSGTLPEAAAAVRDHGDWNALRRTDADLRIGPLVRIAPSGGRVFNVLVRRASATGEFNGAIAVSSRSADFVRFWLGLTRKPGSVVVLVRSDGQVLTRDPAGDGAASVLPADAPLMLAIHHGGDTVFRGRSTVDGRERLFAFEKINGVPVYAGFGLAADTITQAWYGHMRSYGVFFAIGSIGLLLLVLMAQRQARREATLLQHWQTTAERLAEASHQRDAIEEQLRQAQKMEAIGQLTGGIAHDFNNLLAVIIGNAELLQDASVPALEYDALVVEILAAAEGGADLTRRLLGFARQQRLCPQRVDLRVGISNLLPVLERSLGKSVHIMTTMPPALWLARTDPTQVGEALLNLAINGRDAMPNGGTLAVELANTTLDNAYAAQHPEVTAGDYVMLSVTDTGTGMPPEVLARATEPFFTTKGVGHGTGLGLSTVYGFVKQSGGHLKIYSEVGHGTTIRLYLPRDDAGETKPPDGGVPRQGHGETILVVENDLQMREVVRHQLQSLGYQARIAGDAAAALVLLRGDNDFDLLFTDLVLSGDMDGYTLADAARRLRPRLKVLFTTGYPEFGHAGPAPRGMGGDVLRKPYQLWMLAQYVAQVLTLHPGTPSA